MRISSSVPSGALPRRGLLVLFRLSLAIGLFVTLSCNRPRVPRASAEPPGDPLGIHYSPLREITPANVSRLRVAWKFHSGAPGSEAIPVLARGVLYITQPNGVFALMPETGRIVWKFDEEGLAIRGLSYWPGNARIPARVFAGVRDKLLALDAATGKPAREFGDGGYLRLKPGITQTPATARLDVTSPPAIFQDLVIVGGANGEGAPSTGAYGDIRAFSAETGDLVWSFHTVPRDGEPGSDTWPPGGAENRSGTNVWGFFTVDSERGLLFAPTGSPTSDFYGGDRKGDNLYGNTLLALDAATGKLRWYRQLVHHDLWDYDLSAAPALIDVNRNGEHIPAVAQITKMGLLFIFDRLTGEPIFGMEERPVPQSTVPGEFSSATQPFPVKPPPIARNTFIEHEIYNLTPEHHSFCEDLFTRNQLVISPPYTPFQLERNVLLFPSTLGGGNWGGVSYDPARRYLFTNVMNVGQFGRMAQAKPGASNPYVRKSEFGAYARFWDPETKVPCNQPPFGELVAVNVDTGEIAWRSPLGSVESLVAAGHKNTGAVNIGGSLATAGGVVFIAATNDSRFRAFDSQSGTLLWEHPIDANGHTIPVSYLGRDGRQYVVVMAGGGGGTFGAPLADSLTAFTLDGAGSTATPANTPPRSPEPNKQPSAQEQVLAASGPPKLTPAEQREFIARFCGSQCHGMDVIEGRRQTRQQWQATVNAMVARGARGSKAELNLVVDYLTNEFGPTER